MLLIFVHIYVLIQIAHIIAIHAPVGFLFLGSAYPFTSADGSKIYLVTTGYADNAGSISDEQNYGTIYQFDANGANRKVLYRLQSNEEFYGTAASDGEKLYVSIQVVDSNTSSSHWEVRCLDLSNGESSVIYTTDQYGERILVLTLTISL